MEIPLEAQKVILQMYNKFGYMNHEGDDMRRKWTRMVCEQLVYTFGVGSGWGHKASSPTNPPSKDGIAQQQGDGRLFGWDIIRGGSFELIKEGLFHDITGQHFIPVPPVDHLQGGTPPPSPQPPPQTGECGCADDLRGVAEELKRVRSALVAQTTLLGLTKLEIEDVGKKVRDLQTVVEAPKTISGKVNARFLSGGTIDGKVE